MSIMPGQVPNTSELYGRNEGLFTYRMARSLDGHSVVPDTPIEKLARDAVLTALRQDRDESGLDPARIDVEVAVRALSESLEIETMGYTTPL
jgi:hypothetical protein